jgi:hypothetical protein
MQGKNLVSVIACYAMTMVCVGAMAWAQAGPGQGSQPSAPQQPIAFGSAIKKAVVFITTVGLCPPTPSELTAMGPEDQSFWSAYDPARPRPDQLARMRQKSFFGTGFIVVVPDARLGKDQGFQYLITNRHVIQPGIENGKPCKVLSYAVSLNHRGTAIDPAPHLDTLGAALEGWDFPVDDSIDLAATGFHLSSSDYDFMYITTDQFATDDMVKNGDVVEGDPAIFAGLFVQYAGNRSLEPVVRSGAVAMLPSEEIPTTLRRLGHAYLAEVHAFGGNSGSPIFVDIDKFKNRVGYEYRLLGVVAGEVLESADLTLQVTTSYTGTVAANSNVSVIVPAYQVRDLLMTPHFQQERDAWVAQHPVPPANPQSPNLQPAK